ncbi:MAG: VanZ family protein [Flavobacteriaceae bacterium]
MIKHIKKLLEAKNLLLLALLYSVIITIAFLMPTSNLPKLEFYIPLDKIIHFFIYLLLSILWISYLNLNEVKGLPVSSVLIVFIVFLVYGIVIEVLQENLTTTRKADIIDVLANTFGSIIGYFVFLKVKNRIKT